MIKLIKPTLEHEEKYKDMKANGKNLVDLMSHV